MRCIDFFFAKTDSKINLMLQRQTCLCMSVLYMCVCACESVCVIVLYVYKCLIYASCCVCVRVLLQIDLFVVIGKVSGPRLQTGATASYPACTYCKLTEDCTGIYNNNNTKYLLYYQCRKAYSLSQIYSKLSSSLSCTKFILYKNV